MRLSRSLPLVFALFLGATAPGCTRPRWTVVRSSAAPIPESTTFVLQPIDFAGMTVDGQTEAQFVAPKNDDLKAQWERDKASMDSGFDDRLLTAPSLHAVKAGGAAPPPDGAYVIAVRVHSLEPGAFAGVSVKATEARVLVQILAPGNVVVDEVRMRATLPAGSTNAATGDRLHALGTDLASDIVQYLDTRISR